MKHLKKLITLSLIGTLLLNNTTSTFALELSKQPVGALSIKKQQSRFTIKQLLKTALIPVGNTMYIWGGGWNEPGTANTSDSCKIGVPDTWKKFAMAQNSSYDFKKTRFQAHNGLDCSGFVAWVIYNTLETQNNRPSYLMISRKMAKSYADRGFGTYIDKNNVKDHKPGDVMSTDSRHVYLVIGQCSDGSVVFVHSSPPGVQIGGTPTPNGKKNSEAINLATHYMKKYHTDWFNKFPSISRGISYLRDYSQMRWNVSGSGKLSDPDGYFNKNAKEILKDLFNEK